MRPEKKKKKKVKNERKKLVTDLGHESIGSGALVVLENDVHVVVGHEVPELFVGPGDTSLDETTRGSCVLTDVRHVLLEDKGCELAEHWPATATPTWSAAVSKSDNQGKHHQPRQHEPWSVS